MFPAYENGLFSLDLERIVFVYVIKKGCDSVVLHAVCPPPKVIRESLLEVIDSFIRCHTEKKRITDKDGKILMENVVKVLILSNQPLSSSQPMQRALSVNNQQARTKI